MLERESIIKSMFNPFSNFVISANSLRDVFLKVILDLLVVSKVPALPINLSNDMLTKCSPSLILHPSNNSNVWLTLKFKPSTFARK